MRGVLGFVEKRATDGSNRATMTNQQTANENQNCRTLWQNPKWYVDNFFFLFSSSYAGWGVRTHIHTHTRCRTHSVAHVIDDRQRWRITMCVCVCVFVRALSVTWSWFDTAVGSYVRVCVLAAGCELSKHTGEKYATRLYSTFVAAATAAWLGQTWSLCCQRKSSILYIWTVLSMTQAGVWLILVFYFQKYFFVRFCMARFDDDSSSIMQYWADAAQPYLRPYCVVDMWSEFDSCGHVNCSIESSEPTFWLNFLAIAVTRTTLIAVSPVGQPNHVSVIVF